jgi:hypothetical protein
MDLRTLRGSLSVLAIVWLAAGCAGAAAGGPGVKRPAVVLEAGDDKTAVKQLAAACRELGLTVIPQDDPERILIERNGSKLIVTAQVSVGGQKGLQAVTIMSMYRMKPEAKGSPKLFELLAKANDATTMHFAVVDQNVLAAIATTFVPRALEGDLLVGLLDFMTTAPLVWLSKYTPELMSLLE